MTIHYDWSGLDLSWKSLRKRPFDHWRYGEFYPDVKERLDMGEGGTPAIRPVSRGSWFFKVESQNPTGSVKDRGSAIEVSMLKELGAKSVVVASSGNLGSSVAAYCARAGIKCEVILPRMFVKARLPEIRSFGASVSFSKGDLSSAVGQAASRARDRGCALAGNFALRREGEKSVAFELADQLGDLDYVVVPAGDGTLLSSLWRGFKDLYAARLTHHLPRVIGVQATGCAPLVEAFDSGSSIRRLVPKTGALSIACGHPTDGDLAIMSVKESAGRFVAVSEAEIASAMARLAKKEGIEVEPAAASSFAGALKLRLPASAKVAMVLTGNNR